jgi:hypothetical protein
MCDRAQPSLHWIGDQLGDLPRVAQPSGGIDDCARYRGEGYPASNNGCRHAAAALDLDLCRAPDLPVVGNEDVERRLWSWAASDTMSSTCLQAGEDGVPAPVQQGCRDELFGRRMSGGHQDDAGREALPGAAVPAPVVDGRLRYTQCDERLCRDDAVMRSSAKVLA